MRHATATALILAAGAFLGACASARPRSSRIPENSYTIKKVGEHFETADGRLKLIRVQDEFKLLRCVDGGPIEGCYVDVFTLPRDQLGTTTWIPISEQPGLRLAFLSPEEIAVRVVRPGGTEPAGVPSTEDGAARR